VTFDELSSWYHAHQALAVGVGAVAGVGLLLVMAHRLRAMKEHRATLLLANTLTVIAAALATTVSASGMWKFFTDILGQTPLRIAFFAFLEIALFASALLARSRLLREPQQGSTGVDGTAVWVLAGLTAALSAMDSDSFREVCLRLIAPLVAAWMWERALAAERHVRQGTTSSRRRWSITSERILVRLRLADATDRDASETDTARRRATLARARLHLHLLQNKKAFAWRTRRAHRKVIKQAMRAAEDLGLAEFPHATNERQAIQMYMATLYGFVEATSPQAVAHLNAWQPTPMPPQHHTTSAQTNITQDSSAQPGMLAFAGTGNGVAKHASPQTPHHSNGHGEFRLSPAGPDERSIRDDTPDVAQSQSDRQLEQAAPADSRQEKPPKHHTGGGNLTDEHHDQPTRPTAIKTMRHFWDTQVATGRLPSGAELSRAAGLPPSTGLGRRKRREWTTELPEPLKAAAETDK